MRVDVLTLFPEAFAGPLDVSIIRRAREDGVLDLHLHDIREHARDRHRTVDDYPFGGGQGMVMKVDVLDAALRHVQGQSSPPGYVVFLSPQGERLTDALVRTLARQARLVLVSGRYEGVDERFVEHCVDREVSIGDYILTGGELPALVLIDAVTRHVPGVLGDEVSPEDESFAGGLLEHPQYTRPADYRGWAVPDVLLSGHHSNIEAWKREQGLARTRARRPDLLSPPSHQAPLVGAAAAVLEELFDDLLRLLDRCDAGAFHWKPPVAGANSIAALVRHACGSLDAWLARAVGEPVERDRDAEFSGETAPEGVLAIAIEARLRARARLARLSEIDPGALRSVERLDRTGPEDVTAAWCLQHALAHAAEHWGQIRLTLDLWHAQTTERA
ncbi:MAG: tRNA (guanosine(37)-N1)-methyltransferase TrmD [Tepidiformaceae bacterium]